MASEPPKVFISYSHDSIHHKDLVLRFAERLRKDGVDAQIDQYVKGRPPGGWPRWMLDKLDWPEFVLLICTEAYYRRFRGHEELGTGKGALSPLVKGKAELEEAHQPQQKGPLLLRVIFRIQHLQLFRRVVNPTKALQRDDSLPSHRLFVAWVVRP
jgi:hypothetical protein